MEEVASNLYYAWPNKRTYYLGPLIFDKPALAQEWRVILTYSISPQYVLYTKVFIAQVEKFIFLSRGNTCRRHN